MILSTFIKQLDECLEDILRTYPNLESTSDKFLKCKMYFDALKKSNPRLMITTWHAWVTEKYRVQIDSGDINFFVEKDYRVDAKELYSSAVESAINDLRETIQTMSPENITKSMMYIQNLCKLSDLYAA